jgi:hypothetical protein
LDRPNNKQQKGMVLSQRPIRMPTKNPAKREEPGEDRPSQNQPETERYLLQIDRQTKRSFKTSDAARSAGLEIKALFPALQVSIYDNVTKSRTVVEVPKSG